MTAKIVLMIIFVIMGGFVSRSYAMESTNYRVGTDSANEAGGSSSDGTYNLYQNLGEGMVAGVGSSTNYKVYQGFIQPDKFNLYMTISNSNIDFGTLTAVNVSSVNISINLGANSNKGYSLKAYDNTPAGINNGLINGSNTVFDATTPNNFIALPLAGISHYGIVVTGSHADTGYSGGTRINSFDNTTWVNIAAYNHLIKNDSINVEYRAGISDDTAASDNYSATTTYILTGNY